MQPAVQSVPHPSGSELVGIEVPMRPGLRCTSCGDRVGIGGAQLIEGVAFCAECTRRSRPEPGTELGVVD